ncbi:MAG: HAMP domain-containing sensor histidine kinase [Dehalococcoidales bacterium]|jgi:signal transduction histidine kinase
MKSLSFKLGLLYVLSVLLVVALVLGYVEYRTVEASYANAMARMETGPGYVNGAVPSDYGDEIEEINDIIGQSIEGLNAGEIIITFSPVIPVYEQDSGGIDIPSITTEVENDLSFITSVMKLEALSGDDYAAYSIDIDISTIGTFILTDDSFGDSIEAYLDADGTRRFYYLAVEGYENVVAIISFDRSFLPGRSWIYRMVADLWISIPVIIVCAVLFGLLISRSIITPVKRIAKSAEVLSIQQFDRRVQVKSGDEIGSLAKSFNRMADKLQAAFDSQKRFISDAAHTLKTPLASMKLTVTGALENHRSAEECQQVLEFVEGRIEEQESLINEMLFLARADENRLMAATETIDLSKTAVETGEIFNYLFEEKGIDFKLLVEPELFVKADSKIITHLFSNLLENALKNTLCGSVTLSVHKSKDKAVIEVRDTGIGIPAEHIRHLFERFYKVPDSGIKNSGYGLGLAICKSIVDGYNGNISVESKPGEGTTFTVALPLSMQTGRTGNARPYE